LRRKIVFLCGVVFIGFFSQDVTPQTSAPDSLDAETQKVFELLGFKPPKIGSVKTDTKTDSIPPAQPAVSQPPADTTAKVVEGKNADKIREIDAILSSLKSADSPKTSTATPEFVPQKTNREKRAKQVKEIDKILSSLKPVERPAFSPAPGQSSEWSDLGGESGLASYYAEPFHGRRMANGQVFNIFDPNMAAHKSLPLGTRVLVTDTRTGKSITVTIMDRGPYITGRVIDLSLAGAKLLASDFIARGTVPIRITPLFGDGKWVWPTLGRRITQYPQAGHRALDIDGVMGGPVFAIASGKVVNAGRHQFHGNYVEIDHGNGRRSLYGHLSQYNVSIGNMIKTGQLIARIGNTGNVHAGWNGDGSHLHLEIWQDGHPVNPLVFLKK